MGMYIITLTWKLQAKKSLVSTAAKPPKGILFVMDGSRYRDSQLVSNCGECSRKWDLYYTLTHKARGTSQEKREQEYCEEQDMGRTPSNTAF